MTHDATIVGLDGEAIGPDVVISKLHEYYEARDNAKRLRVELDSMAARLGMPRKEAGQGLGHIYLDAYLVGKGFIPADRQDGAGAQT